MMLVIISGFKIGIVIICDLLVVIEIFLSDLLFDKCKDEGCIFMLLVNIEICVEGNNGGLIFWLVGMMFFCILCKIVRDMLYVGMVGDVVLVLVILDCILSVSDGFYVVKDCDIFVIIVFCEKLVKVVFICNRLFWSVELEIWICDWLRFVCIVFVIMGFDFVLDVRFVKLNSEVLNWDIRLWVIFILLEDIV